MSGDPNTASAPGPSSNGGCPVTENPVLVRPRSGNSTTPPPTRTRSTSTRSSSRSSTDRISSSMRTRIRSRSSRDPRRHRPSPGRRLQGHGHRLSGPGDARAGAVQHAGPVRLALPHRRARGQRDDATVPDRAGSARGTGVGTVREQSPFSPTGRRCAPHGGTPSSGVCIGRNDTLTGPEADNETGVQGQIFQSLAP